MGKKFDISVIIPTFNRSPMLTSAIESVLRQVAADVSYELLVVDNNSSDNTRDVVDSFIRSGENVRYQFEEKFGVSNARNCGIANTRSEIIAFLDDDVVAQPDWIRTIKECFDRYPDVLLIGGKVLPRWGSDPPAWLTPAHWSPLALVDYGDEPFIVDWNRQFCLVTANLGVRRWAFEKYGTFLPELDRCEDQEFESRIFNGGDKGLYHPHLVVTANVQKERLSKKYHRAWWSGRGRTLARIRAYEYTPLNGIPDDSPRIDVEVFGVTLGIYKELLRNLIGWIVASLKRQESKAFHFESHARDAFNYIYERYRLSILRRSDHSDPQRGRLVGAELYLKEHEIKGTDPQG